MIKEVAPKAEEEGVESSSSEANGPVGGAISACVTERGGGTSEVGRSCCFNTCTLTVSN